jgi:NAD-dependent dihydropyrimidine dehydrogenase PreA subunit
MPLDADTRDEFGVDDFCRNCQVCTNACPPGAIFAHKQTVRGIEKWYVDFDECIRYFGETFSCAICIAVCPGVGTIMTGPTAPLERVALQSCLADIGARATSES